MTTSATPEGGESQLDKFKAAAREFECDDDPKRFEEKLGKLVKHRPVQVIQKEQEKNVDD